MPRRSAAQSCAIVFAEPDGTGDPAAAGRDGLDDGWSDIGERKGSGQNARDRILGGAAFFILHAIADVARNFRSADDTSGLVFDGGNSERYVEERSIFALADGLVMFDRLSAPDPFENAQLFVVPARWNQSRDRFSNNFFGLVAEETFGPVIPARDYSVEVFADDRVGGRFNDGGQAPARFLTPLAIGDVAQIGCENRFIADAEGIDRQLDENFRAIGAQRIDLDATAEDRAFARFQVMLQSLPVALSQRGRND